MRASYIAIIVVIIVCSFTVFGGLPRSLSTFWWGMSPSSETISADGRYVYVGNYGPFTNKDLDIIDVAANNAVNSIPVGVDPHALAVSRDDRHIYVAGSSSGILSIDVRTKVATVIFTGVPSYAVAVAPDGRHIYVANRGNNHNGLFVNPFNVVGTGSVSVIDIITNTVIGTIPIEVEPNALAISSDGRSVYVTSDDHGGGNAGGTVLLIDTATDTIAARIAVGSDPDGVVVSPDNRYVYVANGGGYDLNPMDDAENGSVSVINAVTNTVTATIPTGAWSHAITVSPDGRHIYVTNDGGMVNPTEQIRASGSVSVIDVLTRSVVTTVELDGEFPSGITISPDGRFIYVAISDSFDVSVIDTAARIEASSVPVGVEGLIDIIHKWIPLGPRTPDIEHYPKVGSK